MPPPKRKQSVKAKNLKDKKYREAMKVKAEAQKLEAKRLREAMKGNKKKIKEMNDDSDPCKGGQSRKQPRIKHTKIWKYYTKLPDFIASCDTCLLRFSYKTTTSYLFKHLRVKHPGCKVKPPKKLDRVSQTHEQISYKENSDNEKEEEEEKIPFRLPSKKFKSTKSQPADSERNSFHSAKQVETNSTGENPRIKPKSCALKVAESSTSSIHKRSEVVTVKTENNEQSSEEKDGFEAICNQVPSASSVTIRKVERIEDKKPDVFDIYSNIKTHGDMIEAMIKTALPTLEESKVSEILNLVVKMGMGNVEDLAFIEVEDLKKILKPVQSRELTDCSMEKQRGLCCLSKIKYALEKQALKSFYPVIILARPMTICCKARVIKLLLSPPYKLDRPVYNDKQEF